MRYDEQREVYRDCRWCRGRGCLYCKNEADKAYKAAFPEGPKPIATFDISTPEGAEIARNALGPDNMRKAFGPGGNGIEIIDQNSIKIGDVTVTTTFGRISPK